MTADPKKPAPRAGFFGRFKIESNIPIGVELILSCDPLGICFSLVPPPRLRQKADPSASLGNNKKRTTSYQRELL